MTKSVPVGLNFDDRVTFELGEGPPADDTLTSWVSFCQARISNIVGRVCTQRDRSTGARFHATGWSDLLGAVWLFFHEFPHSVLMQPDRIRVLSNEFIHVHAIDRRRTPNSSLLPVH
jgi:hypothetical protein